jgi:hypothetical protein
MDADKALKILVDIGVIGKDKVEEAHAALTKLAASTHESGESAKRGAEGFKVFGHESGELRRAFTELHHEFPEAALALRALTNPIGGAITVGILAFISLRKAIEEQTKAVDDAAARYADPTFIEAIHARKEAIDEFNLSLEKHIDDLAHSVTEEERQEAAQSLLADALKRTADAQQKYNDVAEALDMDKLEAEHQRGLMSDTSYFARKLQIEQEYRHKKEQMELDDMTRQLLADTRKAESAQFGLERGLPQRTQATNDAAKQAQAQLDADKAQKAHDDTALTEAKKAEQEAQDKLDDLTRISTRGLGSILHPVDTIRSVGQLMTGNTVASRTAELDKARSDVGALFQDSQRLTGKIKTEESDAQAAKSAADRASAAESAAQKIIDELPDKIAQEQQDIAIKRQEFASTETMTRLEDFFKSGSPIAGDVDAATQVANALAHNGRVLPSQAQDMTRLADMITGQNLTIAQARDYFVKGAENNDALLDIMKRAFEKQLKIEAWIKTMRPMFSFQ